MKRNPEPEVMDGEEEVRAYREGDFRRVNRLCARRALRAAGKPRGRAIDLGPSAPASADAVAVRRWMASVGGAADDLAALAGAAPGATDWITEMHAVRVRGEATSRGQLAVSGDDLVAAGIVAPGPALGKLLAALLEAVLTDPARNQRQVLLEVARGIAP